MKAIMTYLFEIKSKLNISGEYFWRQAIKMSSVNMELWPIIRMTFPNTMNNINPTTEDFGKCLFRSCVLLFRFIPIDLYYVTFTEFIQGDHFQESSPTLTQKIWKHRRQIKNIEQGCCVIDSVEIIPRIKLLGKLYLWFVRILFTQRHNNLRKRYGYIT
jgi:hypothetical protein